MNERPIPTAAPEAPALEPINIGSVVHCIYSDRKITVAKIDAQGNVWEQVEPHHPYYKGPDHLRFIGFSYKEFQPVFLRCAAVTIISIWTKCAELPGHENNYSYVVIVRRSGKPTHMLDAAFYLTNRDDRPLGNRVCSTSSGDIMVLDGQHYLVEDLGFHKLTLVESEQIQKLTSRDTALGYHFMAKHGLIMAAPETTEVKPCTSSIIHHLL